MPFMFFIFVWIVCSLVFGGALGFIVENWGLNISFLSNLSEYLDDYRFMKLSFIIGFFLAFILFPLAKKEFLQNTEDDGILERERQERERLREIEMMEEESEEAREERRLVRKRRDRIETEKELAKIRREEKRQDNYDRIQFIASVKEIEMQSNQHLLALYKQYKQAVEENDSDKQISAELKLQELEKQLGLRK